MSEEKEGLWNNNAVIQRFKCFYLGAGIHISCK